MIAGMRDLLLMIAFSCMVVLFAMIVDLGSGLYKAYIRGDARRSEALKRSAYKFLTYEGAMMVAACIDILMHFARFFSLVGLQALESISVVTILIGIFLCIVELLSIRENADKKTHAQMSKVEKAASTLTEKAVDRIVDAILEKVTNKITKENGNDKEME